LKMEISAIDRALREKKDPFDLCRKIGARNLALLLGCSDFSNFSSLKCIRVYFLCNWLSSKDLVSLWSKMNDTTIIPTDSEPCDYYCVINRPPPGFQLTSEKKKKTVVFRMEPNMEKHPEKWGEWADPVDSEFFHVFRHENEYNNLEWHLGKNIFDLTCRSVEKTKILSTVLSDKYHDPGHIRRVDFTLFLDKKGIDIDVFGANRWEYKNYKKELPYHQKDEAIFPYKYTFNCENTDIRNYFTEKLIDGILGECLVFYSGCYNVGEWIDPRAYVHLKLGNFEQDAEIIRRAIAEDWHTQRLPYIRAAKKKILTEMTLFRRLEKILK